MMRCSLVEGEMGLSRSDQLEDQMNASNNLRAMGVRKMMVQGKPGGLEAM